MSLQTLLETTGWEVLDQNVQERLRMLSEGNYMLDGAVVPVKNADDLGQAIDWVMFAVAAETLPGSIYTRFVLPAARRLIESLEV